MACSLTKQGAWTAAVLWLAVCVFWPPEAHSQVPRTLGYQGFLTEADGAPVGDGTYSVTFRLYEPEGVDPVWAEIHIVQVTDGFFSTLLGSVTPFDVPFDRAYSLTFQPEGEGESEAMTLSATPYSLVASDVADGAAVRSINGLRDDIELVAGEGVEIELVDNQLVVSARGAAPDPDCTGEDCGSMGDALGLFGSATAEDGRGVFGFATSGVGLNYGVFGLSKSSSGRGVHGWANAKVGESFGIHGLAVSRQGTGVFGEAPTLGVRGFASLRAGESAGVRGDATSEDGFGVMGSAPLVGVRGVALAPTTFSHGVFGEALSVDGAGVFGQASAPTGQNHGVYGTTTSTAGHGVYGLAPVFGVRGHAGAPSGRSHGVFGSAISLDGRGVFGLAPTYGVYGQAETFGVFGSSRDLENNNVAGVRGKALSPEGYGVWGTAPRFGVYGQADTTAGDAYGVYGISKSPVGYGVYGIADTTEGENYGVFGTTKSPQGYGVYGLADTTTGANYGVYGETLSDAGIGVYGKTAGEGFAGWFDGKGYFDSDLVVSGSGVFDSVIKAGGIFLIDHPLDPENKLLAHSFVESPDMTNLYTGEVVTDGNGFATVTMPDWFEVLNRDIRYSLTVIGQFAQAIVAQEMENLQFVIQTDKPNVKVSWLVTGIRQDRWAEENRFIVERDKEPANRGYYLHPAAFGAPRSRSLRLRAAPSELIAPPGLIRR